MVRDMLEKIGRCLFSSKTMVFYDFSYNRFVSGYEPPQDELVVKQLTPESCGLFGEVLRLQNQKETIFQSTYGMEEARERLRQGEHCFVCEDSGKIVGYLWFCPIEKYIPEIQSSLILQSDEVYVYNGYVVPEFRGRDIMPRLIKTGCSEFAKAGLDRQIGARMSWNQATERVLSRKVDTELIGTVRVGFFLTFRYMISTCKSMTLVNESSPFEFYMKLRRKLTT
jgi:GNAT superfamily N-acetyltransferase